ATVAIDGVGFDWSYIVEDGVLTNMALMAFSDSGCHPQQVHEDQGYVDSGCSRHMTGNMSYLSNFKEFNAGYVNFEGGANGGRITGKRTIHTDNLNFEDVYFIKELKFNLFSVSQICDKKNNVLFTDTECLVLSPNFKLPDDNQILLRVPRRNNMTVIEAARTMLADSKLPTIFWAEAVNTACYVQNKVLVVKPHNKTPYELFRGRTPALRFMKPFRCHVTIINTLDHLGKFDGKSDEGFFIRYSLNSKAFRVYNIKTRKVEENFHIRFLEDKPSNAGNGPKWLFYIDVLTNSMNHVPVITGKNSNNFVGTEEAIGKGYSNKETRSSQDYILMPYRKMDDNGVNKDSRIDAHVKSANGINDVNTGGTHINTTSIDFDTSSLNINTVSLTVSTASPEATHSDFFDDKPEGDMSNINTTYQVPSTSNIRIHKDHSLDLVIGDVQSGFEDLDYPDQVYKVVKALDGICQAPRAWLMKDKFQISSIREVTFFLGLQVKQKEDGIFISQDKYVTEVLRKFNLLDVKTAGTLVDTKKPLVKDAGGVDVDVHLYRFMIGSLMYHTTSRPDIMYEVCVCARFQVTSKVYIDDIIFGSTKKHLCNEFERLMKDKFQISSIREVTFFLGLQVNQKEDGIFISQDKYVTEVLRKFNLLDVKTVGTLVDTKKPLVKDAGGVDTLCMKYVYVPDFKSHLRDSLFELVAYTDSDYVGASLYKKSTTGGCQFLGRRLISWKCKKQTMVATSTTEAEYVAAASLCRQGEGSTIPVESHYTPLGAPTTSQPPLSSPSRIPTRQETEGEGSTIPVESHHTPLDETASTGVDVRHGRIATTIISLDVGQGSV
nr:hypothetical protein [Tanacetum cinerariifolium]